MKNIISKIALLVLFFTTFIVKGQDFQGKAVYQTKTTLKFDTENSSIPADRMQRIQEMMKSQLEKSYTLVFDKTASMYKEEVKLDQAAGTGRGMGFTMMIGGGASGNLYKNIQTKTSAKEQEFSGKNFLIKDNLKNYNWQMEQETKMIGNYLCFKATAVIEMPDRQVNFRFGRRQADESDENEENKMVEVPVTAWYTLDIPVSNGPDNFWGLPGLILEVSYANTQIVCTKIVLNAKDKETIDEPKKGKEVSQEEYDAIIREKMKEMRDRFQNERQRGGGGGVFHMRG